MFLSTLQEKRYLTSFGPCAARTLTKFGFCQNEYIRLVVLQHVEDIFKIRVQPPKIKSHHFQLGDCSTLFDGSIYFGSCAEPLCLL